MSSENIFSNGSVPERYAGYSWDYVDHTFYPQPYHPYPKSNTDDLSCTISTASFIPKKESENIMTLYQIIAVDGSDRKNPVIVFDSKTVAKNEEQAKLRSGVYEKVLNIDPDYLTIICKSLGEVSVKEKKQVVKLEQDNE